MHKALYYQTLDNLSVKCNLCPNYCIIQDGSFGSCRSRKNVSGILFAVNYGRTVSINLDPIEKKPLYHYYPGSQILSLGANSCNLHCEFCQNFEISQADCPTQVISPDELLDIILRKNLKQIAFTYTEPFTWFEYILDCGKLFKEYDIRIILVTNGYINQEPLKEILPYIDAMNIDLKSIREDFYNDVCKGKLKYVLDTIRISSQSCHIEITNLLIPEFNVKEEDIKDLALFVKSINPFIPLHLSRYYPRWKFDQPPTPEIVLKKAYSIAKKYLHYVYLGNISSGEYSDTYCPNCNNLLINRNFNSIQSDRIINNQCVNCKNVIYGRFW